VSILEQVQARLAELRSEIKAALEQRGALIDKVAAEKRGFTAEEETAYNELGSKRAAAEAQVAPLVEREKELLEQQRSEKLQNETRASGATGDTVTGTARVTDPEIYVKDGGTGHSYFRDLARSVIRQDGAATERLRRNDAMSLETRALGNTNNAGGSGGEFAPPKWMVDQWIGIIRKGRVTPDLFKKMDVPNGISSLNIPKITGGTTTAIQSTQNSALSQTDMTTSYVVARWATIGGKQVASQQILDQTAVNFDQIILDDLAADYAQQVGAQVFTGTGTGAGTNDVVNGLVNATFGTTQTWTQASPTGALFYSQTGDMLQKYLVKRLANPTCWLMHPRRWFWLSVAVDGNGRPLVVPDGPGLNQMASQDGAPVAFGRVGTLHGLPVIIDPQVPTNLGAGTNQDPVYLLKTDDLILLESGPTAEVFRETYADSLGILFRLYSYVGTVLNRHSESLAVMLGTGLITPTFLG
jgi:HK97 family phage major capsid protein